MGTGKVIMIVLDSFGVGKLPDAWKYDEEESNTYLHVAEAVGALTVPNMEKLGLGNILEVPGVRKQENPMGAFGKAEERSCGKDTTTGHWEIAGIVLEQPFPTYPGGFPDEVIESFEKAIGRKVLGNKPSSGTQIIEEYAQTHRETGWPIVYTSADSVFQIAAHESVIPVEQLYEYCRIARKILQGPHAVGRVIARPFVGEKGKYKRTSNRHDFSLVPTGVTVLDIIKEAGLPVMGVGKINDIFAGRGMTEVIHTGSNMEGVDQTLAAMKKQTGGLIFTNLVDFDQLFGHRNDPHGYAGALEEFDRRLPEIMSCMEDEDVLVITADHGCDPTTKSTDHSREYIPVLIYGKNIKSGTNLGVRKSFADIGATVAELLGVQTPANGESMTKLLFEGAE